MAFDFHQLAAPVQFATREEWLQAFTEAAREHFQRVGFPLPERIRCAVGFTSKGARGKRIGECWSSGASADDTYEVFIVPTLADPSRVADILTHELVHTATPGDGHGKLFKQCATKLGLVGKMTATVAGAEWHEWADPILAAIGPLPHAELRANMTGDKKQTTRLLKAECGECGLVFRVTAKWADRCQRCPDDECGGFMCVGGTSEEG